MASVHVSDSEILVTVLSYLRAPALYTALPCWSVDPRFKPTDRRKLNDSANFATTPN